MENKVTVASVRGIKDIDGNFKPHKIIEEELDEAPDLDALVEAKPKGKGKGKKVDVVEPETDTDKQLKEDTEKNVSESEAKE